MTMTSTTVTTAMTMTAIGTPTLTPITTELDILTSVSEFIDLVQNLQTMAYEIYVGI